MCHGVCILLDGWLCMPAWGGDVSFNPICVLPGFASSMGGGNAWQVYFIDRGVRGNWGLGGKSVLPLDMVLVYPCFCSLICM